MSKKRHHYITASYLSLFSPERDRSGLLFITDKQLNKTYKSSPSNAGIEVDYFTIGVPGAPPDLLEDKIAELEDKAIRVLKKIENDKAIPNGTDYDLLITFLSLLTVRTPPFRNLAEGGTEQILLRTLDLMWNKERHAEYVKKMEDKGEPAENLLSYQQARTLIENNEIQIEFRNEWFLRNMLQTWWPITQLLHRRNWHLMYITPNISNRLVTSDRAMLLTWKDQIFADWPPGYGVSNTRVWFPVTDTTLLIGEFEQLPPVASGLKNKFIRLHNSLQMWLSQRFVFSGVESFPIAPPENESSVALQNETQKKKKE